MFLRDRALRLTCGPRRRSLSRYKQHRKTPTHQGLLFNFPLIQPELLSLSWFHFVFPLAARKGFMPSLFMCTENAQFTLKTCLFSVQICPPFWTRCLVLFFFLFCSQGCSCSLSSGVVCYQFNRTHELPFEMLLICVICWNMEDVWCRMTSASLPCVELFAAFRSKHCKVKNREKFFSPKCYTCCQTGVEVYLFMCFLS